MNATPTSSPGPGRVYAIDALRGFDMFWICQGRDLVLAFVGLFCSPWPAWIKTQLDHANWEGFTAYDMIMPLFLFIVGAAMPFSFAKRLEAGQSKLALYRKVFLRAAILFVLGMVKQGNLLAFDLWIFDLRSDNPSKLFLFCNTLQAIAAGYLIASIALIHLRPSRQIATTAALLIAYWLIMLLVPIPGQGAGHLEEHRNLALYIDQLILGRFCDSAPGGSTYTWILSSLAFGATVLLGVHSGQILRSAMTPWKKFFALVGIGLLCLGLGWAWSQPWLGEWRFPINKHLFSSSMVLWSGGWCFLLLAAFYLAIDVLGFRKWAFVFVVIGSNALLAYMSAMIRPRAISDQFVGGLIRCLTKSDNKTLIALGDFLGPLAAFALLWLILWYLYRHKTFIRI